jgi:hypothetical protein
MANGGASVTGLAELRRAIQQLPDALEQALRKHARDTALRIASGMRRRLPDAGETEHATGITKDSVVVTPEVDEKLYRAEVGPAPAHRRDDGRTAFLPNLPVWLEYGTSRMQARPFLRPSVDEERDRYLTEGKAIVEKAAGELLR